MKKSQTYIRREEDEGKVCNSINKNFKEFVKSDKIN